MNLKRIGKNVKKYRKKLGLTQSQLAEMVQLSTVHISHIETGTVSMSLDCLLALCNALQVTPNEILLGEYVLDCNETNSLLNESSAYLNQDDQLLLVQFSEFLSSRH